MRFFKYLVFLFITFYSTLSFADYTYRIGAGGMSSIDFSSPESACQYFYSHASGVGTYSSVVYTKWGSYSIVCKNTKGEFNVGLTRSGTPPQCPESGMPLATYFSSNTPAPTQVCKPNPDGTYCVYNYKGSSSPKDPLVISTNAGQQIILNSVSSIPSPSCTPKFHKTTCDSNDPYGGCYQPPNDQCNRMSDGSIYCPPDAPEPDVSNTCNGATYCKRPPQGCGKGYVAGSFNGQQLCVKTNPSTDNPQSPNEGDSGNTGEGTGTSTSTGTETTTTTTTNSDGSTSTSTSTTTTNNTTINNFKIDLSGVIAAINAVSAQVSSLKNELLTSITQLSNKLDITNSKIDSTNSKIDTTNSKLTDLNTSSLKQEQLLKDIRDKTVTDQPASVPSTDLTGVHNRLDAIKEGIDKKNEFDKEFSEWFKDPNFKDESLTADWGDSKLDIPNVSDSFSMDKNILNASAACPAPYIINYELMGSRSLSFSWDLFCSAASFFRPIMLFIGMFAAFRIATGTNKEN